MRQLYTYVRSKDNNGNRKKSVSRRLRRRFLNSSRLFVFVLGLSCLSALIEDVYADSAEENPTWKVNLRDADLRSFIGQVSEMTGYSFVVDPRVKGKVTIVSDAATTKDAVFKLFHAVLNVHGFAAVKSGTVYKVIPNPQAKYDSANTDQSDSLDDEAVRLRIIPLKNARAAELMPLLRPLVPQYGYLAAVNSANVLIISDHGLNIDRILQIIEELDTAEIEGFEVIQLQEAWVGDVVELLKSLEPVESGRKKKEKVVESKVKVTVVAEERTNRLIVKGEPSARARIRSLVTELDQPARFSGTTKVIYLRHADANKVAEILKNFKNSRTGNGQQGQKSEGENASIQADETLNALVIRAEFSDLSWMEEVVRQLDIRRAQVLIEAAIVEVSGDDSAALGVQWASLNQDKALSGISFSSVGNSLNSVIAALSGSGAAGLADGVTVGVGERSSSGDSGYGAFLQAIAAASSTNLLSTPSIMTLDNEEAEIVVGQNVPFVTGSTTNTNAGTTNPFQTISREDVGLTLKVVPQIHDGDIVRLQIEQEVSAVVPSTEAVQSSDLITNKRAIKTTILAEDGETLVLGGLIQDDFTETEQKVPLLGDIPFIGRLFRSTSWVNVKRNLLVFLQPKIIREAEDARTLTQEKYERIRTIQLEIDATDNILQAFNKPNNRLPEHSAVFLEGAKR